ncbi:SRPBCC family protein [Amycolatopsis magusensis]|uniref:Membrane protein n=1 Tax=Amycolatopsis magusensis TaxID=882444 RepID=A0ABS4Q3I5_9PSEU|nr:SRPBCC family protein [Amycolatopsis magusensis]MBP2185648.1 putative membrane protein [Amycolatopsis magusensis]MDI5980735.1 SRPBCC family protein [Amycolatopsis magusensis]
MGSITKSVDVEVPIGTVYNQWTQFEDFPQFMEGVDRIEQLDDKHTRWEVSVAGVSRQFEATITEQHPEERVAWTSDSGPNHAGVVTFHRIADGTTRVTAQLDIDPEGFVEQAADKLGILDRRVQGDLDRFKVFIEQRGRETGAWRGDVQRPS